MTKQDVINYVMNTPGNTNRAVLDGMLEDLMSYDFIFEVEGISWEEAADGEFKILKAPGPDSIIKNWNTRKPYRALLIKQSMYGVNIWNVLLESSAFSKTSDYHENFAAYYLNFNFYDHSLSYDRNYDIQCLTVQYTIDRDTKEIEANLWNRGGLDRS